jgi:putative ABC transport system permease protein
MADEPTAILDNATGEEVIDLMFRLNREHGTTLLLVTHDSNLAGRCARKLSLAAAGWSETMRCRRRGAPMNTLQLAFRMLSRDWRAGELTILIAAMVLAVASIGTVGFFADRVKGALGKQANLLLGADVLISGDRPLPTRSKRKPSPAASLRRRSCDSTAWFGVKDADAAGAGAVLTDVKAVAPRYPLRGTVMLVDAASESGTPARDIPARGVAWPDTRLAARLGSSWATPWPSATRRSKSAPSSSRSRKSRAGLLAIGPRLLINIDDVPATNLLQPGNRATYRLLVADLATRGTLDPYLKWLQAELKPGQRMENVRDLRPEVRQTLERAEQFLGLSALVAVILAAVAVALAASRYLRRHLDAAAMLRCFGAPKRQALALFVLQFAALGVLASVAGIALALLGQSLLVALLTAVAPADLPPPGILPPRVRSARV